MTCRAGSIREVQRQLVNDGIHISQYALRTWVKAGKIPAVYSGKKAIILYSDVYAFLTNTVASMPCEVS